MSRNVLIALSFLLIGVLACNAPSGGVSVTEVLITAVPTSTTDAAAGSTPSAAPTTAPQPTQGPGDNPSFVPTPDTDDPVFYGPIQYTNDPNSVIGFNTIGHGVKQMWAIWHYANMREGLTVRRVWTKDGEVWIEKEEAWDFAKYGASGIVRDISIYDLDNGLESGTYLLTLYIDGVEQTLAQSGDFDGFSIAEAEAAADDQEYPGKDGRKAVLTDNATTLMIVEANGQENALTVEDEIVTVQWFPDGVHILYVTLDRSMASQGPTFDWKWQIYIGDTSTFDRWLISGDDTQLHDPAISPDGSVIAVITGSGYGDAGIVDQGLAFIYLNTSYQPSGDPVSAREFDGIPADSGGVVYPVQSDSQPLPGVWVGPFEFHALMAKTWQMEDFEDGIYAFFIKERIADRVGDLPDDFHQ
jgi:hypothetical protein